MGGIFLIFALIGVYLVVFWAIDVELKSDKTSGLLGFIPEAIETLHDKIRKAKSYGLSNLTVTTSEKIKQTISGDETLHDKIRLHGIVSNKDITQPYITKLKSLENSHTGVKPKKPFLKK